MNKKNTETQHTPTPIALGVHQIEKDIRSKGSEFLVARCTTRDFAAFIVRAVNSHEALLDAAKRALEALNGTTAGTMTGASYHLSKAIAQAGGK